MKRHWSLMTAMVVACGSENVTLRGDEPPATDEANDGGTQVDTDASAPACEDCVYFPADCTADAFCSNGPFDADTGGGAFDARTRINVLHGRATSDVWAVGALGAIAHFDGTTWARSDPGTRETMLGLWLHGSEELTLGLPDPMTGTLRFYARGGTAANPDAPPSPDGWSLLTTLAPVSVSSVSTGWGARDARSFWVAIEGWTDPMAGGGLLRLQQTESSTFDLGYVVTSPCPPSCNAVNAIAGVSADDVWTVGANGVTMRITAAESNTPTTRFYDSKTWNDLKGVWASSASDAWSVGANGTVRHYTGKPVEWDDVSDVPTNVELNAVSGTSASDVWIVGNAAVVLHYDGTHWVRWKMAGLGGKRPNLTAVWAATPNDVWIGGDGVLFALGGKR